MTVELLDLVPVVPYADIRTGDDFLVDVLGFSSGGLVEAPDGTVVHVRDVDALFRDITAKGVTVEREPTDEDDGQRECGHRDPEGHRWFIATPIS